MLLVLVTAAQAAFLGGLAFVPAGVGALALEDSEGFSGTLASEWDGWLTPPITASAGWAGPHMALLGNLALVETVGSSVAEETHTFNVGGLRLGADWRGYVWPRTPGRVNLWGTAGLFGIVPNAAQADSGWTQAEQDEADKDSATQRAGIGGMGALGGFGAEYLFADADGRPAFALGARWVLRGFGALDVEDTQTNFGLRLTSEAALLLEFTR